MNHLSSPPSLFLHLCAHGIKELHAGACKLVFLFVGHFFHDRKQRVEVILNALNVNHRLGGGSVGKRQLLFELFMFGAGGGQSRFEVLNFAVFLFGFRLYLFLRFFERFFFCLLTASSMRFCVCASARRSTGFVFPRSECEKANSAPGIFRWQSSPKRRGCAAPRFRSRLASLPLR